VKFEIFTINRKKYVRIDQTGFEAQMCELWT